MTIITAIGALILGTTGSGQSAADPDTTSAVPDVGAALADAWSRATDWVHGLIESLPNMLAALVVLLVFSASGSCSPSARSTSTRR